MELVYAAADVLVGRGGATTVAEVAVTGTPAILVPWAGAAEDHQTANVRWLADAGGAVLLPESRVGELGEVVERLRSSPERLRDLGERAGRLGQLHRSGGMAELIRRVALAS
jgi:UDP-N-acetylglucosamine--N-acetylmuramyl-(pentapeptide) pyrophosphoryl-undecaprenol N-acetylglucosamine transferase